MEKEKKILFLEFLEYIDEFIENLEGGDSYFKYKGETYSADMGYGWEFWCQIYGILKEEFSE
jgi:hypothetical protein